MPLNNEVGEEARPEEIQMAAAAMRALKENPTMTLNDAYRWGDAACFFLFDWVLITSAKLCLLLTSPLTVLCGPL